MAYITLTLFNIMLLVEVTLVEVLEVLVEVYIITTGTPSQTTYIGTSLSSNKRYFHLQFNEK